MTTFDITVPSLKDDDKTLDFSGALACGESVLVTVRGTGLTAAQANDPASALRVRVRVAGRDVAMFPEPTAAADDGEGDGEGESESEGEGLEQEPSQAWTAGEDGSLSGVLSLDTAQLARAFRLRGDARSVPATIIVERGRDGGATPTLYGSDAATISNWPERDGAAAPSRASHDLFARLVAPLSQKVDNALAQMAGDMAGLEQDVQGEATRATAAEGALDSRVAALETAVPTNAATAQEAISAETERATAEETALRGEVQAAVEEATGAAAAATAAVEAERSRAETAEEALDEKSDNCLTRVTVGAGGVSYTSTYLSYAVWNARADGTSELVNHLKLDAATSSKPGIMSTSQAAKLAGLRNGSEIDSDFANHAADIAAMKTGKADLVGGKVPADQLPSFVDDVLEFDSVSAFPAIGEAGKIYVATQTNKTYRWSGTQYVLIGDGASGVMSVNGQTGAVSLTASDVGAAPASHTERTDNPHNVTKGQVGLGNVDNTSDENKPLSAAANAALAVVDGRIEELEESDEETQAALAGHYVAFGQGASPVAIDQQSSTPPTPSVDNNSIAIGWNAEANGQRTQSLRYENGNIAIGHNAKALGHNDVVIGGDRKTEYDELGHKVVIGVSTASEPYNQIVAGEAAIAIGCDATTNGDEALAVGAFAEANADGAIAIGGGYGNGNAVAGAEGAVQIGNGTNNDPHTIQFENKKVLLDGDATLTPVYSDTPTFSDWTIDAGNTSITGVLWDAEEECWYFVTSSGGREAPEGQERFDRNAVFLEYVGAYDYIATRERTDIIGYQLGSQADKPLAPAGDYALKSEIPAVPALDNYVQKSQTAGLFKNDGTVDTNTYLTQHQDISGKLDAAKRNLLDYTTGATLALGTAAYRSSLNADGTFPTVDATAIPTAEAYYQFELELAVPSTVPAAITGPTGWDWLDGGEPPDPSVLSGGETIFVACRLDCETRAVTANVWRVA